MVGYITLRHTSSNVKLRHIMLRHVVNMYIVLHHVT